MSKEWDLHLTQWTDAGLLDAAMAGRIRAWEREQAPARGLRWPIVVALAFGAVLIGAGVLLFVSAHWDQLSPNWRMALVVSMVAVFHAVGAAAADRFDGLAVALHAVGTVALGAAIALAGQIYNLNEHWPSAVLMWAAGAGVAWALLRQWPQAALTALLAPAWLVSEWSVRSPHYATPAAVMICGLCLTYLSASRSAADSGIRKALMWVGGLALLPAALFVSVDRWSSPADTSTMITGWSVALLVPIGAAVVLRGRNAVWNLAAIVWTVGLALANGGAGSHVAVYLWCAVGAVGLAFWGIQESRPERVNLAIAGFAITVLCFYFSNVMDRMGRSTSLMLMGLIFLGGGWLLERTRRGLLARMSEVAQ